MSIVLVIIGVVAGFLAGTFGIGGGIVMIPALVMLLGFKQQMAQGTTLAAMIPPIGIIAAFEYYKSGNVNITAAILIALGFLAGSFFGARLAISIDEVLLKRIFGVLLFVMSIKYMLGK
jgi:uncharacterized protein